MADSDKRVSFAFYSALHKQRTQRTYTQQALGKADANGLPSDCDKWYVSADKPEWVEITMITSSVPLSRRLYGWSDVVGMGRVFTDSYCNGARFHAMTKEDKDACLRQWWSNLI